MNIAFWIIIVAWLVAVWFAVSPMFKAIGKGVTDTLEKAKNDMSDDTDEKGTEEDEK